jgi:hypothetical protein
VGSLPRGGPDHGHDAGADGLGESIPSVDDGSQIGVGLPRTSDIRTRLGVFWVRFGTRAAACRRFEGGGCSGVDEAELPVGQGLVRFEPLPDVSLLEYTRLDSNQ